ncbi:hypothetical protein PRIPAC_92598 [Pristionchus pacificus]|uniref:Membrane transporter n=1 Tax=Pristionchus pacificus TaxID=54126 RepID=A0A2A6BPS4_PRIPA|nr:hypothetical protein PRIPAC_92598 [Pristionchus pacificus]|eukprot:PDM67905.1 membrane transporter [Pristionchus pacificus]
MNRLDILLIFTLQWIYMFSSQMYMPLFLNYMPARKCSPDENGTIFCYKVEKKCNRCTGDNCTAAGSICKDNACIHDIAAERPFHSAAEDYGHYCDSSFRFFRTETIQYAGVFLGTIIFGTLSDIWGRKSVLLGGMILGIPSMLISGEFRFAVFYAFRFLTGFFNGCSMVVGWGFISELAAPDKRMHLRAFATYPMGRAIITLICFAVGEWRWANRIISILCAIVVPLIWWLLPESHVWLASQGRQADYEASIDQMNWLAGSEYFKKKTVEAKAKPKTGRTLKKLVTHPVLRKRLLCLFSLWFVTFYTSYGLTLNSDGMFKSSFYTGQFILCGLLVAAKLGASVGGLIGALVLVFCSQTGTIPFMISYMIASIMIELCADICYLAVNELMPTEIRGVTTGISSMVGRVANVATAVSSAVREKWEPGYYIILIVFGSLNWLVSFFLLDETKGVDLNEVGADIMDSSRSSGSGPSGSGEKLGETASNRSQGERASEGSIKTQDERDPLIAARSNSTSAPEENTATCGDCEERTAPDWDDQSKSGWVYN